MKVYFVRHGESVSNTGRDKESRGGGDELTDLGWEQSRQLGRRLAGKPFTRILVSSQRRSQETGAAIAEILDVPIEQHDEIHELMRSSKGYAVHGREEHARFFKKYWETMATLPPDQPIDDGESFSEILERANRFLTTLEKSKDKHPIIVVSHGGFLRFLLGLSILKERFGPRELKEFMKIRTSNTGISVFDWSDGSDLYEGWRLVTWMDQAHL